MRIGKGNQCLFISDSYIESGRLYKHCLAIGKVREVEWIKLRQNSLNAKEARIGTAKGYSAALLSPVYKGRKIRGSLAVQRLHNY
jgi:hypothetical protein